MVPYVAEATDRMPPSGLLYAHTFDTLSKVREGSRFSFQRLTDLRSVNINAHLLELSGSWVGDKSFSMSGALPPFS